MSLPFFLHLLSNPTNDQVDLAASLSEEQALMQRLLGRLSPIPWEHIQYDSYPNADWNLLDDFRAKPKIRSEVSFFHFSGHGEDGNLIFQAQDGHADEAKRRGLASTLKAFENLRLVFLNSCTSEQLAQEIAHDRLVVIASPHFVPTNLAVQMAESFYKYLAENNTIADSFTAARDNLDRLPSDKYRSLFPDDTIAPPDPRTLFKLYPGPEAAAAKLKLSRIREMLALELEKPPNAGGSQLFRRLLHFNYREQKQFLGQNSAEKVMAFLVRGKKDHGIPLLYWMFKEPFLNRQATRMRIGLDSPNKSYDIPDFWAELARTLKILGEPSPSRVIEGVSQHLMEPGNDVIISLYHAQFYGPKRLKDLLEQFWYPLRKGLYDTLDMFWPQSQLNFFLLMEDDNHPLQTEGLEDKEGIFALIPEPGTISHDDIWDFLDRERYWLLPEKHQEKWQEISHKIHEGTAAIPGQVLKTFCKFTGENYDDLNKAFLNI